MKKLLLSLALLSAATIQAQYTFSTFTEPYVNIAGGTSLTNGEIWDDPEFTLEFGFPFTIGGETYDEVEQVGFGSELEFLSPTTSSFVGYLSDIIDGQEIDQSASTITYETSGTPGNRICKLQYFNCAFYNEVFGEGQSADSRVNFQIWFYEINGAIEFRFGANTIQLGSGAHDGAPGPAIVLGTGLNFIDETFDYGISLTGDQANPSVDELSLANFPDGLDNDPEDGRVYRFSPVVVGTDQVSEPTFTIYPTIVDQSLNIVGDYAPMSAYRILAIDGRLVQEGQLESNTIELNELSRGTYVLHLEGSPRAAKFIKK